MKTRTMEVYLHSLLCPALKGGEWSTVSLGRFAHGERAHGACWVGECFVSRANPDAWGDKIDTRIQCHSAHSLVTVRVWYLLYRILELVVSHSTIVDVSIFEGSDHRSASDRTGKLVEILPMICTFERLKILDVFGKSSHHKRNLPTAWCRFHYAV